MDYEDRFSVSLDLAAGMIESGGEISRAEETVLRINGGECRVFALPTLIIAQNGNDTQIRRIAGENTDLARLAWLNSISREMCGESSYSPKSDKEYGQIIEALAVCGATASFCIYFGGSAVDAVISAVIGTAVSFLSLKEIKFPLFSSNLIDSFFAGVLAYLPNAFGLPANPSMIIIGTIMLFVPGLTVVNAIRDMMNSDLIAGIFQLVTAIMSALGIALGISGGMIIFGEI